MIHPATVLPHYDAEMRQRPIPGPGSRVERLDGLVRVVGEENYVLYANLTVANVRDVVATQAEYFRRTGVEAEWKVFGHDPDVGLEALLADEGFVPGEPETLVVFDLQDGVPGGAPPSGIEVRRVTDDAGVADAVRANATAFGRDESRSLEKYTAWFRDPNESLFVAYVGEVPAASARLELVPDRSFAGLWGGGTDPAYRGRGLYRSLVTARAVLALSRGYRYLTVDARATSLPILVRVGFVPLTTTRPWVLPPHSLPRP